MKVEKLKVVDLLTIGGCIKEGRCDECGKKVGYPIQYPNLLWEIDVKYKKKRLSLCPKCLSLLSEMLNDFVEVGE